MSSPQFHLDAKDRTGPLTIAHRGSSGQAPENTLVALRLAVDQGADMLEFDVRTTQDGELIVLHDRNLRRTTNGSGNVYGCTLQQLKRLDAGAWFDQRFTGEKIPTLREVCRYVPPHIGLNIEVKTDGQPRFPIERTLLKLLQEERSLHRVLVSSFDHRFLTRLNVLASGIQLGALMIPVRDSAKTPAALHRSLGVSWVVSSCSWLRKRFVVRAHESGLSVSCYTVNTERQLDRVVRYGIDAVITNFPAMVKQTLG